MGNCTRCSRRAAIEGIGAVFVLSALPVLGGCMTGSNLPVGVASACAGGICVDLTDAANAPLRASDGAVLVHGSFDSIALVRLSPTTFAAVSAICTHENCLTNYDAGSHTFECPCHGSSFGTTGAVLRGPANRAVRSYGTSLTGDVVTITGA